MGSFPDVIEKYVGLYYIASLRQVWMVSKDFITPVNVVVSIFNIYFFKLEFTNNYLKTFAEWLSWSFPNFCWS